MNKKLKKLIFDKLYKDLCHVEIIPYKDSIWFVDREERHWYLEYEKSGTLWWRYGFFVNFFSLFCMERCDFEPIICQWVEEVLNYKVKTSMQHDILSVAEVEEVLNYKVKTSAFLNLTTPTKVEEVLNYKVKTSNTCYRGMSIGVEEVLNYKVKGTFADIQKCSSSVEDVFNNNPI